MFSNKINLPRFILITLNIIVQIESLVELPVVEDNYIDYAEKVIRDTVNNLFTGFKIDKVQHSSRLKQFSTIHNFFVSITLQDCDNLKEIARLTRVSNVDNNTIDFITQINEVLNEGDKSSEANDYNNVYVGRHIQKFIKTLQHLKNKYVTDGNVVIKSDILQYLHKKGSPFVNATNHVRIRHEESENNDNVLSDNEFWQPNGRRIYDGIRTKIKHFPFIASIKFFNQFQCAGTIIEADLIITSASCLQLAWNNRFFRENPSFLSVQVGSDKYDIGGDTIAVLEINFHPDYNPNNLNNNLAILRLARNIIFRHKHKRVKKINFDRNAWKLPINVRKVVVVGWGARTENNIIGNVMSNVLSFAHLDYYPLNECQDHYSKDFVTEKHFCAGFYSRGGGACNRDAGGPGVVDGVLTGVISFGSPICGALDSPTVFTKLGYYVEWIETIMEQSSIKFGKSTTTPASPSTYRVNLVPRTKKALKLYPIEKEGSNTTLIPVTASQLRISHDLEFQEFLKDIFNSKEMNKFEEDIDDMNKYVDYESDKEPTESVTNVEESFEEITNNPSFAPELPQKTTKANNLINNSIQPFSKNVDESAETLSYKMPTRSVTVMENFSSEDDEQVDETLEAGIMGLIDNLDIESILQTERKILKKNGLNGNDKKSSLEQPTSSSGENNNNIDSAQQKILDYLISSVENQGEEKDQGLSISIEPFHDLTLREKYNNNTKKGLSASSFAEMIAFAINEEEKRLKSNRYTV